MLKEGPLNADPTILDGWSATLKLIRDSRGTACYRAITTVDFVAANLLPPPYNLSDL